MYLYCSMVFLAIIATIVGFNAYNNMWIGLLSAFVVVIPSVYSLIPLIMEYRKSKNVRKNKLTESIFTDRKEDLEDIIRILNVKEHCIQITGEEEQCGKTWMAKRLCDYINNQNDPEFRDMKLKCAYVTADYLDMDNYTEMELNAYFKDNIVTNKTVLIFDHVDNFKIILSKQRQFHFQMIYILKYNASPSLTTHTMSAFCQNHIEELQRKIKEYYPGISVLTQNEVDTLFQLTDGNIGRITALLSEQKCVLWIKDISNKKTTEYEECLHKIEMDILVGKYQTARQKLSRFESDYKDDFYNNIHLAYKYYLILSNCEHMLNQYQTAIDTLSIIELKPYTKYNSAFEIDLHKAHYNKHMWNCNEALEILENIYDRSFAALVDSLGILAAKYFVNDLYVPNSSGNSLEEFYKQFQRATNSSLSHNDYDNYKLKRYAPIFFFYKEKPAKEEQLIQMIDEIIKTYESENNRLRANAYFVKAEIYRLKKQYEKAIVEYKRCLDIPFDNNIRLQTNLMAYYLIKIKKINLDFELMSENEFTELSQNNLYSHIVRHRIRNIELGDSNAVQIQEQIDSRIMPIL